MDIGGYPYPLYYRENTELLGELTRRVKHVGTMSYNVVSIRSALSKSVYDRNNMQVAGITCNLRLEKGSRTETSNKPLRAHYARI